MKSTKNILTAGIIVTIALFTSVQISAMRMSTQEIINRIDYNEKLIGRYNEAIKEQEQIADPKNINSSLEEKNEARDWLDIVKDNIQITKDAIKRLKQQLSERLPH